MQLILKPVGWQCQLNKCPPGFFVRLEPKREVGFKQENGDCYSSTGQLWWGEHFSNQGTWKVQPCVYVWDFTEMEVK